MSVMLKRMMMFLVVLVTLAFVVAPVEAADYKFDMKDGGGYGEGDPGDGDYGPRVDTQPEIMPILGPLFGYNYSVSYLVLTAHYRHLETSIQIRNSRKTISHKIKQTGEYDVQR